MTPSFYIPRWFSRKQCHNLHVPARLMPWLFDSASLTAHLMCRCGPDFNVQVLSSLVQKPTVDESMALGIPVGRHALVRQVKLQCGDTPWVYARTVIPLKNRTGPLFPLTTLGNRPLGAVLFANKLMRRGQIEIASIPPWAEVFAENLAGMDENVWGRRSLFTLKKRKLLVSEFFLADLPTP